MIGQGSSNRSLSNAANVASADDEDEEDEDGTNPTNDNVFGTEDDIEVPKYFIPICLFAFFLYGPMSSLGVHDILSRGDDKNEEEDKSRSKKRDRC